MEAILWAIHKPYTDYIKSGKKTIEVRKLIPKDLTPETPNFIYETKTGGGCGKVIGEFKCEKVLKYECSIEGFGELSTTCGTCLTYDDILNYCGGNDLYGLHISELKIYDKPKDLSEFRKPTNCETCGGCARATNKDIYGICQHITRPPQNFMYVEV